MVLSKNDSPSTGNDLTSIAISFSEDRAGQLFSVLKEFAEDTDFVAGVLDAFRTFYANAQSGN